MSSPVHVSGSSLRRSIFQVALIAFAGLGLSAQAQTAPQLLPYTARLIAGGGTVVVGAGGTCPVSGFTSTDAYGDGCLANEIEIGNTATGGATPGARGAVADASGNVFFTDYNNGLVRRVDATTGVVTAVAGGGTTAAGTSSGAMGTAVKLDHPAGIAFAPNGNLYFSDTGNGQVYKIAATGGSIPSTGGIISLVVGSSAGTYGYAASNTTTTITPPTGSYLRAPYGIAFDSKGDLFMVDEYTEAILVLNTNATGTNTLNGVPVAAGTIWKIAGTSTGATAPYCVNGTATGYGCNYGLYTEDVPANTSLFDSTYSVAVDPNGVVYAGDEYYNSVFQVSAAGILSTYAGIQDKGGKNPTTRAKAGSFSVGSIFGVAADANSNVYFTDASSGVIWRVDGAGLSQYVVAGGATAVCAAATDAYGDGCPATQATFGSSGSGNYATATLPGPGVYAVSVDAYSDLFTGDTEYNLVREVASGTQFGVVGANQPIDIVDIHFAQGDGPAATSAYTLTAGSSNFSLGTATCTINSDTTTDCLLPITATPTTLGLFTGTLQVTAKIGGSSTFPLTGIYEQSPVTRTSVTVASTGPGACTTSSTSSTSVASTLTATVVANGPSAPTGTITFYANGTQVGTPQTVKNLGTTAAPVYGATLTNTFSTAGTYAITATYSGDSYFKPSTGKASTSIVTSAPTFTTSAITYQQNTIAAGQTALYSFNLVQNVYYGTITFAVTGLPQYSTATFSPTSIAANGCSQTSIAALSVFTQQAGPVKQSGIGMLGGGNWWRALGLFAGFGLALLVGLRRRKLPLRYSQIFLAVALLLATSGIVACGSGLTPTPATPSGTYSLTVTVTGSAGGTSTFTLPLTVK